MAVQYNLSRAEQPIANNPTSNWLLIWSLDVLGSILSVSRPTTVQSLAAGCQAYTYSQIQAYKGGNYTHVMLTSLLHPEVRWIFNRNYNAQNQNNIPAFVRALTNGGNDFMSPNTAYLVVLDPSSSTPSTGTQFCFMHNNNGSEPGDIPTLGVYTGSGFVWTNGMFWGCIDAFSNYGGLLNQTTAHVGSAAGTQNDRLLVYIR